MKTLLHILKSRPFWWGVGGIVVVQLVILGMTTPMYELDSNSYIQGMFTWDIYHNPFMNFYVGALSKIWKNLGFLVAGQVIFYAVSASLLVQVLFRSDSYGGLWSVVGIVVAALEPLTMFYNFSLLSESFFTSFTIGMVAMLVLLYREGRWGYALLFGTLMGFAFLARLSAMIYVPLFGLLLLGGRENILGRGRNVVIALLPFVACYAFVFFGQKILNDGGLYTVKGRVMWDFMSSQYHPSEIEGNDFKRYVNPYIFENGVLEPDRELRREKSYLGYKDCVAEYEQQGIDAEEGILICDSVFGAVGQQIKEKHFWAAEWQFFKDNLYAVRNTSYLEYRFTPGLPFYHDSAEYAYLDSVMTVNYGVNMEEREEEIPRIWRSLEFGNAYMTVVLGLYVLVVAGLGLGFLIWGIGKRIWNWEWLAFFSVLVIPLGFYLTYISYRPRFMAPYLVLMVLGGIHAVFDFRLGSSSTTHKT